MTACVQGVVVKPAANLTRTSKGIIQPGLKVRGREYLRIIYRPDCTEAANLVRLRDRRLGHKALHGAPRVRARSGGARSGRPR
ncbi:MAG TPA: hypothetical protein VIT65_12825 [Microlunatus sp.]